MPQNNISNNTPQVNLNGINDLSIVPLVAQSQTTPMHLPLFYIQAPTGPVDDVVLLMPGDLTRIYGDAVVDYRQPYLNHATVLLKLMQAQGNACFVKRIVRPTIVNNVISNVPATASLTLMCTVDTVTPIYEYSRDINGVVINNISGSPVLTANVIPGGIGLTYNWVSTEALTPAQLEAPMVSGNLTVYPLITVEGTFIGEMGNSTGIRLWTAGPNTANAGDIDIINDQQALIFNAQLLFRGQNTTPVIIANAVGDNDLRFCFKPGAYNYKTNQDFTIQDLVTKWSDDGIVDGLSPTYGPLGKVTVHENNLETLLHTLHAVENNTAPSTISSMWLLDFLTATDMNGNAHYGFQVNRTGSVVSENYTYYLQGGNDGDLSNASFETAIISEINNNFQNPLYPLIDSAKFPFSCMYDSGFSNNSNPLLNVKKTIMKWTSYRKDVHVAIGTHVVGEAPLTVSEEISVGTDLKASAMLYAESALWGTPACRIVLMMQSGLLTSDPYTQRVSTVFDLGIKRAGYLGASSGFMKTGLGYDIAPANQVTVMKKLSNTFLNLNAKNQVWAAGLNSAQSFDRRAYFFPALQTVYGIQQSVLTGEMLMQICCDVTKQSQIVWRLLTGNSNLTEAQFIKRSNELLLSLVDGRYDGRVIIVPNTYFTAADQARGYSWTLDVTVFGNVPKTVATVNVITQRQVVKGV